MDYTEFSFLPKREQEYVTKYAGPFPVSEPLNAKYAWCREAEGLLSRLSMRKRVNDAAPSPVFADVYTDTVITNPAPVMHATPTPKIVDDIDEMVAPPPHKTEKKKSVSEILSKKG